jgi:CheY-like chemotaxis protein
MVNTNLKYQNTQLTMPDSHVVWLVDDDLEDAKLIMQALQETIPPARVVHLSDCEYAWGCLQSRPERRPSLLLVGLNAPGAKAFQFLKMIKADETLKTLPIVALAKSREECDVSASYALGLAGYVVKSEDPVRLREEMAIVRAYWTLSLTPRTP